MLSPSFFLSVARARDVPSLHRAAKALDAWQLEKAMQDTAFLLACDPNDYDVRAFAAEVMHQRGHHEQALAILGEGRLAPPHGPAALTVHMLRTGTQNRLADMLPQLRGSAAYAPTFQHIQTPHFRIAYQDKDELTAWYAQDVLEAAYKRIGSDLDAWVAEDHEPIGVEIYPTAQGLSQATGLRVAEIESSGTIAVCKYHRLMIISPLATRTGYPWADTLAHELTHLMISKKSHNTVPIWLHEGIAKYYESRWRDAAGLALTAHSEHLLQRAVEQNNLIPFARMHPSMAKLPSQHDAALAFAEVFAMVEHIVHQRGPKVMAHALAALGQGVALDDVLSQHFGGTLTQLEQQLRRALKTRSYRANPHFNTESVEFGPLQNHDANQQADSIPQGAVDDPQAADDLRLGELLAVRGHFAAAVDPYQRAYARVGDRLPALGFRLAQALQQADAIPQALAVLASTVAAHPEMVEAQGLYATLLAQNHQLQQAAPHLLAYCLHNPFNSAIHTLWAAALSEAGDAPGADRETRFAKMALAPRVILPVPPAPSGAAMVTIMGQPWADIALDDPAHSEPTPIWQRPISPGSHTLYVPHGPSQAFTVGPTGVTHVRVPPLGAVNRP